LNINDKSNKILKNDFTTNSNNNINEKKKILQLQISSYFDFMKDSFLNGKKIEINNSKKNNINFKLYFKSLIEKKSDSSKKISLVRNLWKNKISEENIIYLSIQVESLNKNLFNYEQFTVLNNKDISNLKNFS
jgi:hypothetical protein